MKNYMLSYPRTASSFIRYAIEKIVRRPTEDCGGRRERLYGEIIPYINNTTILRKEHFIRYVDKRLVNKLVLLRNYKDVYISHNLRTIPLSDTERIYETLYNHEVFFKEYYNLIDFYHNFNGDKILLYFEDIENDKFDSIKKIIDFLLPDDDIKITKELVDSLEDESKKKYRNNEGARTDEKKILHSILTLEQNMNIDKKFRDYNIELYDKYLNRYKTIYT